ncbi:MAG: hybrid sensor histidine kinase/response regulator [Syntrophobacterales bacterium]|nr:hybrid sensor histidine kinase/response regulator [Syntrophobacterales bacterium]
MVEKTNKGLILVIDDEESIRDGCRQTLEKSGYDVVTAENGEEGVRIAREIQPDVAFVDLKMPSICGIEIIDVLSKDISDIVLIVITGYASIVSAVDSMKRGAYDYLPKPFTPDQLRAVAMRGFDHRNLKIETRKLREEKEQMEKNFITFVSHEMRSPLLIVEQYLEALRTVAGGCLDKDANDIIERCNKRIHGLKDLVEHWLDISHIESGIFTPEKKPVDIPGIIMRSVEDMTPLYHIRELSMETDISEDIPEVTGDEESLVRVLANIMGNAAKYTPSGGKVSIRARHDEYYVSISISDTGTGIPKEKLPFIFEPFYRVKGKEEKQRGSGLGLNFCKKIMEAHGGKIEVTSQVGEGTTFVLELPK